MPRPSRLLTVTTVPDLHIDERPRDEPRPAAPRRAVRLAAAVLAAAALAGCGGGVAAAPLAVQPPAPAGPLVPDVVGESLDVAKTALDVAGFAGESQDVLRDREQLVDDNWVVCTQDPGPVPTPEGTVVALGVVKDVERCPGSAPATTAAPTTIPAPTSPAAPSRPAPQPAPRPAPAPDPEPADEPAAEPTAEDEGDEDGDDRDGGDTDSGGGSSAGTVHPGSFCDPPGIGVSKTGKAMVCAPGSDGRDRWQGA